MLVAMVWLTGWSSVASAQTSPPPDSVVSRLFNVILYTALGDEFPGSLLNSIAGQLSSYPVGTSSGGFTYTFDRALGISARSTRSFGPAFAERALTIGEGKVSVGFNFQRAKFDRFEDQDLTALVVDTYCCGPSKLTLNLTSTTAALIVQAGLLPRLDVAVVVPIVRVDMDVALNTKTAEKSAAGIGDVALKAKYNFFKRSGGGVAAAVDWRLATGDKYNLLGSGASRVKLYGVASTEVGKFAPHVNVGLTTGAQSQCPSGDLDAVAFIIECYSGTLEKEFNFSGGVDVIADRRLTVLADVIARHVGNTRRFRDFGGFFDYYFDPLTTVLGSTGFKLNVHGNWLVTGSVLFPLNRAGLRSRLAPSIGVDYAF
jgi:hypothetical protein